MDLKPDDLRVGATYSGKKSEDQDRTIIWISPWKDSVSMLRYTSRSLGEGRWAKSKGSRAIMVKAFLKWAQKEVKKPV